MPGNSRRRSHELGRTGKGVSPLKPVKEHFRQEVDYYSYMLQDTSQEYQRKKIFKFKKRLKVQMNSNMFDPTDQISIFSFLNKFKAACDSIYIKEGAEMWIVPKFLKNPSDIALTSRLRLEKYGCKYREVTLNSYLKMIKHLLAEYESDEIIAEKTADINAMKQQDNQTATKFSQYLWEKVLRCKQVYEEYFLKGIFIEGLYESFRHIMRTYWEKKSSLHFWSPPDTPNPSEDYSWDHISRYRQVH